MKCNCEYKDHFDGGPGHPYGKATAGTARAEHVGAICDECVDHMRDFLVP